MARKVPKWLVVLSIVAAVILVVAVFVGRSLLGAIDDSKLKRSLADVRSLITAMETYRKDHGSYPVTFHAEAFCAALKPQYIRLPPCDGVSYYSDGANYALVLRPMADTGAAPRDHLAPIEVRNGEFVGWPDLLTTASIQAAEAESRRLFEQPED